MKNIPYYSVPIDVRDDSRLSAGEKLLLMTLYSYIDDREEAIFFPARKLCADLSIKRRKIQKTLDKLSDYGWIEWDENNECESCYLMIPENIKSASSGSRIAKAWPRYFGTRQLTPYMFEKITAFIEEGMEENLIIRIMKMASRRVDGNPYNYILSVLTDFRERDIYTYSDYKEEKQRVNNNGRQLQKDDKEKERRTPQQELEDLYKKGYR